MGALLLIAVASLAGGATVAAHYAAAGLTLVHYDARAHLVVARRIIDSITPGWQQIGAVWLPLPHLLNAIPVQVDSLFRNGGSAVALSVLSHAASSTGIGWLILRYTGSRAAAVAGVAVFALNPNVLYLQATPMTEPLLLALSVWPIGLLMSWCGRVVEADAARPVAPRATAPPSRVGGRGTPIGWLFALACLTRYEAWPVTVVALTLALWSLLRAGVPRRTAARRVAAIAAYPAAAILGFTVFSRIVVGAWFASGFFVPENPAQGRPLMAAQEIVEGLRDLSGSGLLLFALTGAIALTWQALRRTAVAAALPLALAATAAVPWVAFLQGHPFRIRYMVPLIGAQAILAGIAVGRARRLQPLFAAALLVVAAYELRPLDASAPMIAEARRDQPNATGRDAVTACLREQYRGGTVMASMGSLGHYMQDLSSAGFSLRDFLHEGNGDIWLNALDTPRPYVGWMLIEEEAEGGDMLAAIVHDRPAFLEGFTRVCEGGGVVLYRRM